MFSSLEPHLNFDVNYLRLYGDLKTNFGTKLIGRPNYLMSLVVHSDEMIEERVAYGIIDYVSHLGGIVGPISTLFSLFAQSASSIAQTFTRINALLSVKLNGKATTIKLTLL